MNTKELSVGDKAPNFTLPSTDGGDITLSKLAGQKVLLFFYPKDMTSGCTQEAHEFTELNKKFKKEGVLILGISCDSIESHHKFIKKEGITFPLLADENKEVVEKYGVWKEKSMYGKKYMGIERSTFVIDKKGKITQIYRKVSVPGHAICVLEDTSK